MIRKCMHCEKIMGIKAPWFSLAVTVGICPGCKTEWEKKYGAKKSKYFLAPIGKVTSNKLKELFKKGRV